MLLNSLIDALAGQPERHLALAGVVLLLVSAALIAFARRRARAMATPRDPQRAFTAAIRRACFDRAGGRCEYDGWLPLTRCRAAAAHADHFIPWSKGGASTLDNAVASCARHNLSKSASMPSRALQRRLQRHRARAHQASTVGARYGQPVEALR